MATTKKVLSLILITLVTTLAASCAKQPSANPYSGFLRAEGQQIVDGNGTQVILKGVGFGGWMKQEPYMMDVSRECQGGQHVIFDKVRDLLGEEKFEIYRKAWLRNYCQEKDVRELSRAGVNSIRLPLHYNLFTLAIEDEPTEGEDTWLDEGFALVDQLLAWCVKYKVYLILDLHAAPGGQGRDSNISGYDPAKASLWESKENRRKTVALWKKIAERYYDESWIGGYDIINETNWSFEDRHPNGIEDLENRPLKELSEAIIKEIRTVDTNHIVFIEGNGWGNNHRGLWPINDDNVVLSFHKYWNAADYASIAEVLMMRERYNVPLWMGEAGENSTKWYRDTVTLLEEHAIGWCWWTYKKMEPVPGVRTGYPFYSVKIPGEYYNLKSYWGGYSSKPDQDLAFKTMMKVADNVKIEHCLRNDEVFTALLSKEPLK